MTQQELIDLANDIIRKKSETQTIEVKSAEKGCPKKLYDTLSSFSNQDTGGVIIFGISEDQNFQPVTIYDPQDLQKQVTEKCNQMQPSVRAVFTLAELNGKLICSAEIPGLDVALRPCYYKGIGRIKGSYIRVGDADLPMSDYEIYSYEAYRKHLHDDERPVRRASLDLLDNGKLSAFIQYMQNNRPGFSKLSDQQTMEILNITHDQKITLAAVLNFAIIPQGYFPQLDITAVRVPGFEIGDIDENDQSRFSDNQRIDGTIASMVEQAIAFCIRNMKTRTIIDSKTGKRVDRTEYPIQAIREAILNALIHRDYSIYTEGTPVQLCFFNDRLEIHSPGGLYGHMTIEQLGVSRQDLRNPALAVMTEALTGAENRYSGIPTMRREMAAHHLPEPVFENRRNEFVVTFYNATQEKHERTINAPSKHDVLDLLKYCETPRTRQEIAAYLGLQTTFYAMNHYVKPLIETERLFLTLPDKPKSKNQKYYAKSEK